MREALGFVRAFVRLYVYVYVYGKVDEVWATQRALFLEQDVEWSVPTDDGFTQTLAARCIIDGPGLAGALWTDNHGLPSSAPS